jgi:putative transcriptional regulator
MPIVVRIDVQLARRKMSVGEFAQRIGLTPANVAVLKNGRAKAVRFTTLEAMCRVLGCQPGDLLEWVDDDVDSHAARTDQQAADPAPVDLPPVALVRRGAPVIEVRGPTKRYGDVLAVDDLLGWLGLARVDATR